MGYDRIPAANRQERALQWCVRRGSVGRQGRSFSRMVTTSARGQQANSPARRCRVVEYPILGSIKPTFQARRRMRYASANV